MPILLILILLPLVEIALFVAIGGRIGVWPVLALVVLGALTGVAALRGRLAQLQGLTRAPEDPARLLAAGALTAMGAALLILPGFLTDALGLVLLLPPVQRWVADRVLPRMTVHRSRATVIEGEFTVHDPSGDTEGNAASPTELEPPRRH